MRKIVASEYISLDGIVEAGWTGRTPALSPADELTGRYFNAPEVGQEVGALSAAADTLLLGRVTSPRQEITALKQEPGRNINVSGSATLVRWLLREHLLDELHPLVFPVVMGGGTRLFTEGTGPADLGSAACTSLGQGVLHLEYHPGNVRGRRAARLRESPGRGR